MQVTENQTTKIINGDCYEALKNMPDNSVTAIITDPPYGLKFMGKKWDYDVPKVDVWKECLRVLMPGGTLLCFAGTRTQHRMAVNIEDAGFVLKDTLMWLNGSGFPKAADISKNIEKKLGKERVKQLVPTKKGNKKFDRGTTYATDTHTGFTNIAQPSTELSAKWEGYKCLTEDTEILTTDGWKSIDEIGVKHKVFGFTQEKREGFSFFSDNVVVSEVNNVWKYDYDGDMVRFKNKNLDFMVTPNHNVLCKRYNRPFVNGERIRSFDADWRSEKAENVDSSQYQIPTAGIFDGDYSIGTDIAELVGWILTEGHYPKDKNSIIITQSSVNKNNVDRIRELLSRIGVKYTEGIYDRTYKERKYSAHYFRLSAKDALTKRIKALIPEKKPIKEFWFMPLEEKRSLYEGLMLGDGCRAGGCEQFSQKDVEFLEWFQVFTSLMGLTSKINYKRFRVTIKKGKKRNYSGVMMYDKSLEHYKGRVWCVSTDNHNFFAKSNGKIFITGNSHSLKPAYEPIIMAMKPNEKTYADNAIKQGVSGLNIDGSRITKAVGDRTEYGVNGIKRKNDNNVYGKQYGEIEFDGTQGRFPANIIHDSSEEVVNCFPETKSGAVKKEIAAYPGDSTTGFIRGKSTPYNQHGDSGSAARYFKSCPILDEDIEVQRIFYTAKASKKERNEGLEDIKCTHPTVKPLKLMEYLVGMIKMPENTLVLDPFMGSGTTGIACKNKEVDFIGIEIEEEYYNIAKARINNTEQKR